MNSYVKDPSAVLDYAWDWTEWLTPGEAITWYQVTAPVGVTKVSDDLEVGAPDESGQSTFRITVWLSGGTVGQSYSVACRVMTSQGRTDERSIRLTVRER